MDLPLCLKGMRRGVHDEELNTRVLWPSVYSANKIYINIYFTANSLIFMSVQ